MVPPPDPYKALNLPHSADMAAIKQSYRQLARKYHPDTWSQPCFSESDRKEATAKFTEISNAYALLTNEKEKAEYDRIYRYGGYDTTETQVPPARRASTTRSSTPVSSTVPVPPPSTPPPHPKQAGWSVAVDPSSKRTYYYNQSTGQSSWVPPNHSTTSINEPRSDNYYKRMQDGKHVLFRPDSHQCAALCSLCLCPPIGAIAMYHSWSVDRCWQKGQYGEAVQHARQAPQFACLGNVLGILFWVYWVFVRDGGVDWPDDFLISTGVVHKQRNGNR